MFASFESSVFTAAASPVTSMTSRVWPNCMLKSARWMVPALSTRSLFGNGLEALRFGRDLVGPGGQFVELVEPGLPSLRGNRQIRSRRWSR